MVAIPTVMYTAGMCYSSNALLDVGLPLIIRYTQIHVHIPLIDLLISGPLQHMLPLVVVYCPIFHST